ncbi:MAG: gamma-glutamyl-gamma-aminobutyrate hydrolase family protein, partial [Clostridiales bacterium]|nr:gamma-glutamyl-gamma-aminobutyrate hydrolase family protein [Clostridiales bacterium]
GGHDVSPALYQQPRSPHCGPTCPARDRLETALYARALAEGKPVLGICRGIQLINVLQGGTLYQDLPTEFDSPVEHHMAPPYTNAAHRVTVRRGTPLHALLQTEEMGVNSYHHQAVKALGADLEVMALSEDGLVEAVRHTGKPFVWGFQWHPEFDFQVNPSSRRIFEAFLAACQRG